MAGEPLVGTYNPAIMRFSDSTKHAATNPRRIILALILVIISGCGERPSTHQSDLPVQMADDKTAAAPATPAVQKTPDSTVKTIRVAAASDLKFALQDIIGEFQTLHPGTEVQATFGSSGNFYAQLCNKAPFDVFLSADSDYPRKLIDQGHAAADSAFKYAIGQIVVWVRNESSIDVGQLGMRSLLDPSLRKIAITNPRHAPYGRAAEAAMKSLSVYDEVRDRLVFGENVAQTAQFVESGAADIGIIALSLAISSSMKDKGRFWIVPQDAYPKLEQSGIILAWANDQTASKAFCDFVVGEHGRALLGRQGFLVPGE